MTAREEWRAYWPIVLACMAGMTMPVVAYVTLGLFLTPLSQEFGWSRTLITAGTGLVAALTIPAAPFVGAAIDKWGARKFLVFGLVLMGLSIASFGLANGSPAQWLGLWSVYAAISLLLKYTAWMSVIVHAFKKGRSLALAIILCGPALGSALAPPLAQILVDGYGWRTAYLTIGIGWMVPTWFLAFVFIRDVRPGRKTPHRGEQRAESPSTESMNAGLPGLSLHEALRNMSLWRIALATFITLLISAVLLIHKVPILELAGVSRRNAALLASLSGIATLAGTLTTGWLMERFHPGVIGAITNFVLALALIPLLDQFSTPATIVISMLFVGFAGGTKAQVCSYLTSVYGGLRNFGKIYGVMSSIVAVCSASGGMLGGLVYDLTGSYEAFILLGIPAASISGLLLLGLGPIPDWGQPQKANPR
jgi:predicted MFS family arabinose efflux permease